MRKLLEEVEYRFITKDPLSIELLRGLWLKEEISQLEMELVVSQFMAHNSMTKTLLSPIQKEEIYQWRIEDQTQIILSSS